MIRTRVRAIVRKRSSLRLVPCHWMLPVRLRLPSPRSAPVITRRAGSVSGLCLPGSPESARWRSRFEFPTVPPLSAGPSVGFASNGGEPGRRHKPPRVPFPRHRCRRRGRRVLGFHRPTALRRHSKNPVSIDIFVMRLRAPLKTNGPACVIQGSAYRRTLALK